MADFGTLCLFLALATSAWAVIASYNGWRAGLGELVLTAERAVYATWALVFLAVLSLEYCIFADRFDLEYVASYSNRALPRIYKVTALWGGQAGSLLFWEFILITYASLIVLMNRRRNRSLMPLVVTTLLGVSTFFLGLVDFLARPFVRLAFAPEDGNGLNPQLQNPFMAIHPPCLYLGYVGLTLPFAFAMAALATGRLDDSWFRTTRRWTILSWFFLGTGILLGGWWAYVELGWGGYWAWDPVENASLIPWLTCTAFLHSVMMQEKRGMMRVWNVWLVFTTFLIVIISACLIAFLKNRDSLRSDNQLDSMISRESSFLFNTLILLVACVAVLSGTLFPVLSEAIRGSKISVGPPFFNRVNIPIAMFLLFLTGVGPLLAWRKTSMESLRRNFGWPLLAGVVAAIVAVAFGLREFYVTLCLMLSAFVTFTVFSEFYRGARVISARAGSNLFSSAAQLAMRNTRRYGGYVIHFGMVLVFIGISGTAFNQDKQMDMAPGSVMGIGPYTLHLQNFDSDQQANYSSERATIDVDKGGKSVMMLYPQRRFYPSNEESGTMVAISSTLKEDLYVVYAGRSPDSNLPVIHAYLNPLVKWIWLGGLVVVLGTILALLPNRQAVMVMSPSTERSPVLGGDGRQPARASISARSQLPNNNV